VKAHHRNIALTGGKLSVHLTVKYLKHNGINGVNVFKGVYGNRSNVLMAPTQGHPISIAQMS
jgi:PII-like signaling protein